MFDYHIPELLLLSEFTNGWYDASHGLLLSGNGEGSFSSVSAQESGFFALGETREITLILDKDNNTILLVGRNNLPLLTYKLNESNTP